jgi:TIR domain
MTSIFLSYSTQDYFFAEMLAIKLEAEGFKLWRDLGSIRPGDDWRQSIENGIKESVAVVVALSTNSAQSAFVTYEWAYALGMSKPVIPVKLSECKVHPRLEPTHYVDFSYPKSLPWAELINRLKEVEVELDLKPESIDPAAPRFEDSAIKEAAGDVLSYLNSKGFTMASFERLNQVNTSLSLDMLNAIIAKNPGLFRHAKVKGGKPGIAKRVP